MNDETRLSDELSRRAQSVPGSTLTLDDVRGTARRIRRRRRGAVAAVVAAAVVGVAVMPLLVSGGDDRRRPEPAPPVGSTRPGTSVLHDRRVTLPDGSMLPIPVDNADVSQVAVLSDHRVVVATSEPYGVSVYFPDGALQARYTVQSNALTTSPTRNLVAWVGESYGIEVLESGVGDAVELPGFPMPGESPGSIDAVLGSGCPSGCRALGGDGTTTDLVSTVGGTSELATSEPLRITDVSPDGSLWAVEFPAAQDQQYGCVGVYEPTSGTVRARSCETSGLHFAPDGEHLLGGFFENNMASTVSTYDLDLQEVFSYDPAPQVISRAAWADASHLLVAEVGLDDNRWSLDRVGTDGGDPEVVDGPAAGRNPEIVPEYLPTG